MRALFNLNFIILFGLTYFLNSIGHWVNFVFDIVSLLNQDSLFVKPFFLLAIRCAKNQDTFHVLIAHITPKKSGYIAI